MKITSINFIDNDSIPKVSSRNTENQKKVQEIFAKLKENSKGLELVGEFKQYERYSLQKSLQKLGAKVVVSNGLTSNGKPGLKVRKLSDQEWKEWIKA